MRRDTLVGIMDDLLQVPSIPDKSLNGLQVEGRDQVHRVAVAVDACQATIDAAIQANAHMLLVHHGLFWGRCQRAVGMHGNRLRALFQADLNLYAAHLPLDTHPVLGNNAELVRLLGITEPRPFGDYHGVDLGFAGQIEPVAPATLARRLAEALGVEPRLLPFGPDPIRRLAVVSGGGSSVLPEAIADGLDALVTGEGPHETYCPAEEGHIHVFFAGHYATETLGVRALARWLEREHGIPWVFLDHPTGL